MQTVCTFGVQVNSVKPSGIPTLRRSQEFSLVKKPVLSPRGFEEVARVLREMDVDRLWAEATDLERRVIVEEWLESVAIFPAHLEVTVKGAPRLNVTLKGWSRAWRVAVLWCRRGDLNPHGLTPTWPSTMRVYQVPPLRRARRDSTNRGSGTRPLTSTARRARTWTARR